MHARRDDGPRHLHVDHDAGHGAGEASPTPPRSTSSASTRYIKEAQQQGHPHHPVHHRRQGRPLPAAVARRTTPTPTSTSSTAARDGVVIRGAKLHITGGVARPRPDDDPDQVDEGRRGGLRHRRHGAGQRAGREDHQHDLRAAPRGHPRLPGVGLDQHARGLRHLRRRVRARTSASSSTARSPSAALFAHSLGLWERLGGLAGMADGADVLVGLRPADRRGQRPRRRRPTSRRRSPR